MVADRKHSGDRISPSTLNVQPSTGLRLRVQDLDFEMKQLTVRDGKGAKDRFTVLAEGVIPALREHLANVRLKHQEDLAAGNGAVYLPGALDRKYLKAA